MRCGLLGHKLSHSYSPQIHRALGDYPYLLFEVEPETVEDFLRDGDFTGINVTIPYKKAVLPYCSDLSEQARRLGAVNTVIRRLDGSLWGHNTDYFGFSQMIAESGLSVSGKKVLVLGSGGASVTAVAVLEDLGARVVVISRNGVNNYSNLHLHFDAQVIINATPVGMYPNNGQSPLDITVFPNLQGVLDLIYNPARTKLLLDAEKLGLVTQNGLYMLVAQAKESAEYFLGKSVADGQICQVYRLLQHEMENIVLVGMPGSGKTTVGKLLAEKLHRRFIDTDEIIRKQLGCSIVDFFAQNGEEAFRNMEAQIIRQLGKESGLVIATGGGCVTREENYGYLHQNGKIVWLKRDISSLPTDGRPLSQAGSLEAMYYVREPFYRRFSDISVDNLTPQQAVDTIIRKVTE